MDASPETSTSQTARCHACGMRLDPADRFCRACGRKQHGGKMPWYYEPIAVILLGFFVLGAFAIPLALRSPKFTPAAKWTLSFLLFAYTVGLIGGTIWLTVIMYNHFADIANAGRML